MRALAIVNPRARRGRGLARYAAVRREIEQSFAVDEVLLDEDGRWIEALDHARGRDRVIAVGGDGTVHAVANALLSEGVGATLAAVGVGSSNDYHKPVRRSSAGIPLRIDAPQRRDVGLARWVDDRGVEHARFFLVSASIGFVARANRRFGASALAGVLGARSVSAAIGFAATSELVRQTNIRARLSSPDDDVELSNVSVLLTPFIAGGFRHPSFEALPHAGCFGIHVCTSMGRVDLVRAMLDLRRGRARGESFTASSLRVDLVHEDDLELDGEVFRARTVTFALVERALEACS